ncbi:sugar ABC transporter permease [Lachnospiraceae bacterium ASD3451]|nr:sugar ABC transporter permease [Diplocloster agilis]MBU9744953.1 sugar ABC transporter permease [Diplocloster agilis]
MLVGMLFVAPSAIAIILMMVYPILQITGFSFSKITLPFFDMSFTGLDNFKNIFSKAEMGTIVKNTLIWTILSMVLRVVLGFAAAMVMESKFRGMKILRTCALIPWVIPSIVASNTWRWIYSADNGLLNTVLRMINPDLAANWLGSASTALTSVIIAYSWAGFPFIMLMLVAAMQGIPMDYKEAAKIDGANSLQVFRYITLPSLKQILTMLIVLEFINGINSFDMLYVMTGGGPGIASEVIGLTIYRYAFKNLDFATASTISFLIIIVMIIAFLFYVPASAKGRNKGDGAKRRGIRWKKN